MKKSKKTLVRSSQNYQKDLGGEFELPPGTNAAQKTGSERVSISTAGTGWRRVDTIITVIGTGRKKRVTVTYRYYGALGRLTVPSSIGSPSTQTDRRHRPSLHRRDARADHANLFNHLFLRWARCWDRK